MNVHVHVHVHVHYILNCLRSILLHAICAPATCHSWRNQLQNGPGVIHVRSFSVATPRLWNHLPTKLKSCHSITRFKSLLKTHLMSQFFKDDVLICTLAIVHVSHNVVFAITVNCLYSCLFCFRALSTQQGEYVRATNLIIIIIIMHVGVGRLIFVHLHLCTWKEFLQRSNKPNIQFGCTIQSRIH